MQESGTRNETGEKYTAADYRQAAVGVFLEVASTVGLIGMAALVGFSAMVAAILLGRATLVGLYSVHGGRWFAPELFVGVFELWVLVTLVLLLWLGIEFALKFWRSRLRDAKARRIRDGLSSGREGGVT